MAAINGRVVGVKRYPNENISFITITIGGVKRLFTDDFVTLRPCVNKTRSTVRPKRANQQPHGAIPPEQTAPHAANVG